MAVNHSHGHGEHHHHHAGDAHMLPEQPLDPASQSLADALRRSFGVLKVLMLVLVALYLLSGIFTVKQDERAVVLRFGDIVGKGTAAAVKEPNWHWSLPFPFDSHVVVNVAERELPVEFMLQLTDEERTSGKMQPKYNPLSPERDDYVVTGDANILHISLKVKYRVTDVVDYITHVYPAPDPTAGLRSAPHQKNPEYSILRNLTRDAVIATAARFAALDIRGDMQDEFLLAVASNLIGRLDALESSGRPLGITVDRNTGVIAPKSEVGDMEAIMPPPQTKEAFDQVFSAETKKSGDVTRANTAAKSQLIQTAGDNFVAIAQAVENEAELLREVSAAESAGGDATSIREKLKAQRKIVEDLLLAASGNVRTIIENAKITKNQIIQEAQSDYDNYLKVLPEYLKNPRIFLARLRDEARARAIAKQEVVKVYVPEGADTYWLKIPREMQELVKPQGSDKAAREKQIKSEINAPMIQPKFR